MNAARPSIARSMALAIFSPTTTPMLPPMKPYSMAAMTAGRPSSWPVAVTTASFTPVAAAAARRRSWYDLVSLKPSGSVETRPASCSVQGPSKSIARRSAAVIRKWWPHFPQTERLAARSLL